jgi:hypothetical protein
LVNVVLPRHEFISNWAVTDFNESEKIENIEARSYTLPHLPFQNPIFLSAHPLD